MVIEFLETLIWAMGILPSPAYGFDSGVVLGAIAVTNRILKNLRNKVRLEWGLSF